MTGGRAYRGKRCMGGQLVYTPDGDVLDKHLHVLRRAPGGFDWGPEADEARIDQLAIALLADSATKNIALDHYKMYLIACYVLGWSKRDYSVVSGTGTSYCVNFSIRSSPSINSTTFEPLAYRRDVSANEELVTTMIRSASPRASVLSSF